MNTEMQLFKIAEFSSVLITIEKPDKVLFCDSDVARVLGYQNPSRTVKRHCKHAEERYTTDSVGRQQKMLFMPESDVYRLIFRSKLQSAKLFEKWVVNCILPKRLKSGLP